MDAANKCCSTCKKTLPPSSFLATASADLGSRAFVTCFRCRQRSRSKRRVSQPLGPPRPPLQLLPTPVATHQGSSPPAPSTPANIPLSVPPQPMSAPPVPPPGAGFLPAEQWGYIRDFHKELDEVRMETCSRCQERWFAMDLKDGICHSCFLRDKGDRTPFLMSGSRRRL